MRLALDTNVLVAAFTTRGACHDLFAHCMATHEVVASDFILEEFERVMGSKLRVPAEVLAPTTRLVRNELVFVNPRSLQESVCRDADDDRILAAAETGDCRCIVTGDADLLILREYRTIRIVKPADFWAYEGAP